jgi:hypothetical protein
MNKQNRFKKVSSTVLSQPDSESTAVTFFTVEPLENDRWLASIVQVWTWPGLSNSTMTIGHSCSDFDVLKAMENAQTLLIECHDCDIDATNDAWNQIVVQLEKQFGFSLA